MKTQIRQQWHVSIRTLRTFPALMLGMLVLCSAPGLARAQYDFTTIDIPGATATFANGDSSHAIAGEFDDADGNTHGFVLNKRDFSQIDNPNAEGYTSVNGINARGDIAGLYIKNDQFFGYFLHKGEFTTIDPSGSGFTVIGSLNARGQIAGYYRVPLAGGGFGPRHGFVWYKGDFTFIDDPSSAGSRGGTRLVGINDHGQIAGGTSDIASNHLHGLLLSRGVFTAFDVPGSEGEGGYTLGQGINNRGQIVGDYGKPDGSIHGFVLSDGVYTTIDIPGATSTQVFAINAQGEIVGTYDDANGVSHGFVGTPTHK